MNKYFYYAWFIVAITLVYLTHYNCYYTSFPAMLFWGILIMDLFFANLKGFKQIVIQRMIVSKDFITRSFMDFVPQIGIYGMVLFLNGNKTLLLGSTLVLISKSLEMFAILKGIRKCQISS